MSTLDIKEGHSSQSGETSSTVPSSLDPINSLATILISGHSETMWETYEDNYRVNNAKFRFEFSNYDNRIIDPEVINALFEPKNRELILAVNQGTCSLGDYTRDRKQYFKDMYTRDASNLKYIFEKSLDIPASKYVNNRTTIEEYILNIKDPLNDIDTSRYLKAIIFQYLEKVESIQENIVWLLDIFNWIKSIIPNDTSINPAINSIEGTLTFFNELHTKLHPLSLTFEDHTININIQIADFKQIIQLVQQTIVPINFANQTANVNEDINNLVILYSIIEDILPKPSTPNTDIQSLLSNYDVQLKELKLIKDKYSEYIAKSVQNDIPLFVESYNKKLLLYEGIFKNSFWRSENHNLTTNDTEFFLRPNPGESLNDIDSSYGLNIFALMLNLNSKKPEYFLPQSRRLTRTDKQNIDPDLSGYQLYDTPIWRDHRLHIERLKILDKIVNIFKQNWFGELGTFKDDPLFPLCKFIEYTLANNINFIKTSIGITRLDNVDNNFNGKTPLEIKTQLESLSNIHPLVFVYCRVLEFTYFLTRILIGDPDQFDKYDKYKKQQQGDLSEPIENEDVGEKVILLSELMYLFQYLLKFDYVVYIVMSCRILQDGQQVDPNLIRFGGNKSKRRKYNKRKTLKRKTLKRKILKRKSYKRRTYKRRSYRKR